MELEYRSLRALVAGVPAGCLRHIVVSGTLRSSTSLYYEQRLLSDALRISVRPSTVFLFVSHFVTGCC